MVDAIEYLELKQQRAIKHHLWHASRAKAHLTLPGFVKTRLTGRFVHTMHAFYFDR
jgi:hypothetical protein